MSAAVPADMIAIVIPRLYAVTTHCRPDSPTLKSDWIAGNATFTINASKKIMKRPRLVATRVKSCVLVIGRSNFSQRQEFRAKRRMVFIVIVHYQNQFGGDDPSRKVKDEGRFYRFEHICHIVLAK